MVTSKLYTGSINQCFYILGLLQAWVKDCCGTYVDGRSVRRVQDHTDRLRRSGGIARYWHNYTSYYTASHRSLWGSLQTGHKSRCLHTRTNKRSHTLYRNKKGDSSPSWHKSPLTPGGQRQFPLTGSQLAPFLHLQGNEQFLPKNPSEHAVRLKNTGFHQWQTALMLCVCFCVISLTLVAEDADPPVGAFAAGFPRITFSPIQTVITG